MHVVNALAGEDRMTLKLAILMYANDDPLMMGFDNGGAFCTVNPVLGGEIGAGFALDEATLARLVRLISGEAEIRDILPSNVLYASGDRMLWFAPPRLAPIWFRTGRREFDLAMNGSVVAHPGLVFLARPGRLAVWAVASAQRPEAETPLCVAPYFNIYNTGAMCEGNVALPKSLAVADIPVWERSFFETEFTHSNRPAALTSHPGGHDLLWKEVASHVGPGGKDEPFPAEYLMPAITEKGEALTVRRALNQ